MKTDRYYLERQHMEDMQRLRGFRPIDDDFMRAMFKDNIPLVQLVLRIITGMDDLIITHCKTQKDLKRVTGARSVCLDAYGTDSDGRKYDLEIQRSDIGATPRRARYHSSVMDVENLDAGQDFSELPDTYTIFITENDIIGDGKAIYCYKRIDQTNGKALNDGTYIIYVNGQYRGNDDIGRLMHDFNCTAAKDMNYKMLADATKYLKETTEGVKMMCRSMEEMRNAAKAEGHAEGLAEGRAETALNLYREGFPIDKISKFCSLTVDEVENAIKSAEQ